MECARFSCLQAAAAKDRQIADLKQLLDLLKAEQSSGAAAEGSLQQQLALQLQLSEAEAENASLQLAAAGHQQALAALQQQLSRAEAAQAQSSQHVQQLEQQVRSTGGPLRPMLPGAMSLLIPAIVPCLPEYLTHVQVSCGLVDLTAPAGWSSLLYMV